MKAFEVLFHFLVCYLIGRVNKDQIKNLRVIFKKLLNRLYLDLGDNLVVFVQ